MEKEMYIEDSLLYQAISEHLNNLDKSLRNLYQRVSDSLKRMEYMDKYKIIFHRN